MNHAWRKIGLVLLIVSLLAIWGCGSKINQENYNKIELGMSYDEVVAILGEPAACKSILGTQDCDWGQDDRMINLKFAADNVVFRSAKGL